MFRILEHENPIKLSIFYPTFLNIQIIRYKQKRPQQIILTLKPYFKFKIMFENSKELKKYNLLFFKFYPSNKRGFQL